MYQFWPEFTALFWWVLAVVVLALAVAAVTLGGQLRLRSVRERRPLERMRRRGPWLWRAAA